jgi:hypothetical protein
VGTCNAEQNVCRHLSPIQQGRCWGRRWLKKCPHFACLISPKLGGRRYFGFLKVLSLVFCLCFMASLPLSLAGTLVALLLQATSCSGVNGVSCCSSAVVPSTVLRVDWSQKLSLG